MSETETEGEPVREARFTIPELLEYAMPYVRAGRAKEAAEIYELILEHSPEQPDALHYLGVCRVQEGKTEEALDLIRRSIALAPDFPDFHNNLGNLLMRQRRYREALDCFEEVTRLAPRNADAWNNRGIVMTRLGDDMDAEKAYRRALSLEPRHSNAMFNLARVLMRGDRFDQAIALLRKALDSGTEHANTCRQLLAHVLRLNGDLQGLSDLLNEWVRIEKENATAQHLLAASGKAPVPERASDAYIVEEFDEFAQTFDLNLKALEYKAPTYVTDALARRVGEPTAALDILDAGCGTGLCGPMLRPFARSLVGVDLSKGMLARAVDRGYDRLEAAELTAFLEAAPASADAVVSADVLVYFGELKPVMAAFARALRPGGLLIYTTEELFDPPDGTGYRLQPHGRYCHSEGYSRAVLGGAGLEVTGLERRILRYEKGNPVKGMVITAEKAAA
jgi:predicted TPR repeat methyltransferase